MLAGRIVPDAGMVAKMRGSVAESILNFDAAADVEAAQMGNAEAERKAGRD